jgi:hypothetical protein
MSRPGSHPQRARKTIVVCTGTLLTPSGHAVACGYPLPCPRHPSTSRASSRVREAPHEPRRESEHHHSVKGRTGGASSDET